jgi:hypothetical protein
MRVRKLCAKKHNSLSTYFNLHNAPSVSIESVLLLLALCREFPSLCYDDDNMQLRNGEISNEIRKSTLACLL